MRVRNALAGASLAAVVMCALWLAPASGAKAKFRSTYSGSFSGISRSQSPKMLQYTTFDATGVKLRHYKTETFRGVKMALYKFTAGQLTWHTEYNVDGCAYTFDQDAPLTSFKSVPPGQTPLFLSHLSYMKRGTYKIGGNFPAKITETVDETCTADDGTVTHRQITPYGPSLSPWTGVKTKLPRIKGHFNVDEVQGDETDHAAFSWDLVGN